MHGAWDRSKARLPEPRGLLGTAVCTDHYVYVMGGRNNGEARAEVYAYNIAADEWVAGPKLPLESEVYPTLVGHGSAIMVAGGIDGSGAALASVFLLLVDSKPDEAVQGLLA